jgi:hypothetical protein
MHVPSLVEKRGKFVRKLPTPRPTPFSDPIKYQITRLFGKRVEALKTVSRKLYQSTLQIYLTLEHPLLNSQYLKKSKTSLCTKNYMLGKAFVSTMYIKLEESLILKIQKSFLLHAGQLKVDHTHAQKRLPKKESSLVGKRGKILREFFIILCEFFRAKQPFSFVGIHFVASS